MKPYLIVQNSDGTHSITYSRITQDVNGKDVEIFAENHRRSLADVQEEINHINENILSSQNQLKFLQVEIDLITQSKGLISADTPSLIADIPELDAVVKG